MDSLTCRTNLVSAVPHILRISAAESDASIIQSVLAHLDNSSLLRGFCYMETDLCKMPLQMASETANQMIESRLHCDRHELLGSSEHCKLWVQKIYGDKSFESITDSQLKHRP